MTLHRDQPDLDPQPDDVPAESIERLFRDHNNALVQFLASRLRSDQEAREVAQEAYVRLLQLDRPAANSFLRASLFRIASNLMVDRLRHRDVQNRATRAQLFEEWDTHNEPERQLIGQQELHSLRGFLAELPVNCRRAYLLYRLEDKSQAEIADALNVTPRMVRHHLNHALVHCRLRLNGASLETVRAYFKR